MRIRNPLISRRPESRAVLINTRPLNGPFIRNDNKKSSALSQLLAITLVLPIDEARDFIIMRRVQAQTHMRLTLTPSSPPSHRPLFHPAIYNAKFRSRCRARAR